MITLHSGIKEKELHIFIKLIHQQQKIKRNSESFGEKLQEPMVETEQSLEDLNTIYHQEQWDQPSEYSYILKEIMLTGMNAVLKRNDEENDDVY